MPRRAERRPRAARLVAPAAFLLAATVAVLLVRSGLEAGEGAERTTTARETTTVRTTSPPPTTATTPRRRATRQYVIQAGDTLDLVALRYDTTVERLLELNPQVDPNSLQVGQRIRVP